jgi:hypothetical protein
LDEKSRDQEPVEKRLYRSAGVSPAIAELKSGLLIGPVAIFHSNRHYLTMSTRRRAVALAVFAAAMLFSVLREWSAPIACPRLKLTRTDLRLR